MRKKKGSLDGEFPLSSPFQAPTGGKRKGKGNRYPMSYLHIRLVFVGQQPPPGISM